MSKIFLCHASEDSAIAERIQLSLTAAGHDVFFDEQSLPAGGDYHARIEKAIAECDLFIFLISRASISPGKFTLTELKLARDRWPNPIGHVLAVNLEGLSTEQIPAYPATATLVSIDGNAPSEIRVAVDRFLRKGKRSIKRTLSITLAIGSVAVSLTITMSKFNAPSQRERPTDVARLVVQAISLESRAGGPHASIHMAISNLSSERLLVDTVRVGVVGTSKADGSTLVMAYEPIKSAALSQGEIKPIELAGDRITSWTQMGKPSALKADFATHYFTFWIQAQATIGATGRRVMLDVEVPTPAPMNCLDSRPCVAVYDLNIPLGATAYKQCVAVPVNRDFGTNCATRNTL